MISSHITHQFQILRVGEIHMEAAAAGLATQVPLDHPAGLRRWLVRWLPVRRGLPGSLQAHAAAAAR